MWGGATAYMDKKYPNQIFAKDGEIYTINGRKTLVIGGAYSVDKPWRLATGNKWFESEQPDDEIKKRQFQTSWSLNGGSLVIIMASGRQGSSGCYITI